MERYTNYKSPPFLEAIGVTICLVVGLWKGKSRTSGVKSNHSEEFEDAESGSSPQDLVLQAQNELPYGTAAFRQLVERYTGRVYRRAVRLVGSVQDAEEVTQDVFLRIFRSIKQYSPEQSFEHWLLTIATNSALNLLRTRYRETRKQAAYVESRRASNSAFEETNVEHKLTLDRALATLDPTTRTAISLRFLEAQTYSEIAVQLDMTQSAVKMRVHRGIEQLRMNLAEDD